MCNTHPPHRSMCGVAMRSLRLSRIHAYTCTHTHTRTTVCAHARTKPCMQQSCTPQPYTHTARQAHSHACTQPCMNAAMHARSHARMQPLQAAARGQKLPAAVRIAGPSKLPVYGCLAGAHPQSPKPFCSDHVNPTTTSLNLDPPPFTKPRTLNIEPPNPRALSPKP